MGKARKLPPLPSREEALRMLTAIVCGRANDCARLALEENPPLDALDLTLLQEIRRGTGGTVEVRLVDRLRALELLLSQLESDGDGAAAFFAGLDQAGDTL